MCMKIIKTLICTFVLVDECERERERFKTSFRFIISRFLYAVRIVRPKRKEFYICQRNQKKIRCEKCQKAFCICATQQHSVKWRFSVFSVAFEFHIFNLIFDGFCTQLSCMYCNKVASAENCAICSAKERPKTKE